MKEVAVGASERLAGVSGSIRSVAAKSTFEFIKDGVVFIQVTEFGLEMVVDVDDFERPGLHVHVPNLESQVIAGDDVSSVPTEFTIRDGGDDFGEE